VVEVIRAKKSDEANLENLLQLYLLEFSEIDGSQVSNDGRFEYPHLTQYWGEPDRHPFLFKVDGAPAGFALVKKGSEVVGDDKSMDVAEFFVIRNQRLKGTGRTAFKEIVRMFPGPWIVRVVDGYEKALAFWRRAIPSVATSGFDSEAIDDGQRKWIVFSFAYAVSDAGSRSPSHAQPSK